MIVVCSYLFFQGIRKKSNSSSSSATLEVAGNGKAEHYNIVMMCPGMQATRNGSSMFGEGVPVVVLGIM